ncbi:MAG: hypothetical protein RL325_234 [Planctomycetota bacterium]|jgi:type II secretory pathway pseudopilin PulG
MARGCCTKRRAFTIVEMLAVVGVIVILMSVLVPSVSSVRREGLSVSCQSNLRQMHSAIEIYRSTQKCELPMCDFLPAATPEGPVGGLPEVLEKVVERSCECWYCAADYDEEGSIAAGTSYIYLPGLLRYTPQVQIQVGALMMASQGETLTDRQRERRRRDAESRLVSLLYRQSPSRFALLADSQDRHKIGGRNPRNALYMDGSVTILRDTDEEEEP